MSFTLEPPKQKIRQINSAADFIECVKSGTRWDALVDNNVGLFSVVLRVSCRESRGTKEYRGYGEMNVSNNTMDISLKEPIEIFIGGVKISGAFTFTFDHSLITCQLEVPGNSKFITSMIERRMDDYIAESGGDALLKGQKHKVTSLSMYLKRPEKTTSKDVSTQTTGSTTKRPSKTIPRENRRCSNQTMEIQHNERASQVQEIINNMLIELSISTASGKMTKVHQRTPPKYVPTNCKEKGVQSSPKREKHVASNKEVSKKEVVPLTGALAFIMIMSNMAALESKRQVEIKRRKSAAPKNGAATEQFLQAVEDFVDTVIAEALTLI